MSEVQGPGTIFQSWFLFKILPFRGRIPHRNHLFNAQNGLKRWCPAMEILWKPFQITSDVLMSFGKSVFGTEMVCLLLFVCVVCQNRVIFGRPQPASYRRGAISIYVGGGDPDYGGPKPCWFLHSVEEMSFNEQKPSFLSRCRPYGAASRVGPAAGRAQSNE